MEEQGTWGEYSRLVLKELETLNDNYAKMKMDMDLKFADLSKRLGEIKNIETKIDAQTKWMERVNEVWSPTQMQLAKDSIEKQDKRIYAFMAILTFIGILIGWGFSVWSKVG